MASMFKNKRTTLERAEKFISPLYFTDVNLYGRIYPECRPFTDLTHYIAPDRISFEDAVKKGTYKKTSVGFQFGPTWTTHWFQVIVDIPEAWCEKEVHLRWDSEGEVLVWSKDGSPLQGMSGCTSEYERNYFVLSPCVHKDNLHHELYVEMACNNLFGAGSPTMISSPDLKKMFTLQRADVAIFDREVYSLIVDLEILVDIAKHLPDEHLRKYEAMYTANRMINTLDVDKRETFADAKGIAQRFFSQKNGASQHTIHAIGNCHIDSAWLWTYAETIRKCARSWSSTVQLMEKYPDYRFACSQAQQFLWVKEKYPTLYEKIKLYVDKGQFIPVGGTWVEMDGNLPSGESFVRQFLYGQHFFEEEFGLRCKEFWLPDTFGYSAQLPQIMRLCGINRFMTQKLSWSLVNKFPHHSFHWEGIDGSSVLAHFAPAETYSANMKVSEALKTVKNLEDKGRVSSSLLLFGHGDGGGGPTEAMLERQTRMQDVDGIPKIILSSPNEFFESLEKDAGNLCRWVGELYLELHNATYTTHAITKKLNRECEFALKSSELLCSIALALGEIQYPSEDLKNCWRQVLLNQFHDVLPGSCILEAQQDAEAIYRKVKHSLADICERITEQLFGGPVSELAEVDIVLVNPLSWSRVEILEVPWPQDELSRRVWIEGLDNVMQSTENGTLVSVVVGATGYQLLKGISAVKVPVVAEQKPSGEIKLRNQFFEVIINSQGELQSLVLADRKKEFISKDALGNQYVIFDDIPLYWDAWDVMDYHLETRKSAVEKVLEPAAVVEKGPLRAVVKTVFAVGKSSTVTQQIIIDAVHPYLRFNISVNWNEAHKFLKVEFPVNILSRKATYEIQFGHLERATHFNTSWDWAKYEVYAQKWADLSEYGHGVSLMNTCKYGHAVHGNVIRLSLLRASKSPDDKADIGNHEFSYALFPHKGSFQEAGVIQRSYELNSPIEKFLCASPSNTAVKRVVSLQTIDSCSWFHISTPAVILDTVKKAENQNSCLVLRFYEAFGSQEHAMISTTLQFSKVAICNALEDEVEPTSFVPGCFCLVFKPFQVISVLFYLKG